MKAIMSGACAGWEIKTWLPSRAPVKRPSQQVFLATSALLFVGSAALTIRWCDAMSSMGEMPMRGGWNMSMTWMRMPEQTWLSAAASFVAMWLVMMIAMMLPSLVPMLQHYRRAIGGTSQRRLDRLTAIVGAAYFFVWMLFGMAIFPLGVAVTAIEMRAPSLAGVVPIAVGVVVLIAGALQFTTWKSHCLACCRADRDCCHTLAVDRGTAWRHGLRLGLNCCYCCANWTAILLVIGVMDSRAMAAVTAAITAERLAPEGQLVARAIGTVCACAGVFMVARAVGLL